MYRYRRFIINKKKRNKLNKNKTKNKTSKRNPISKSGYTLERSDRV